MKIIDVAQNSKDWLTWRTGGIGASNAAAVLGISPWTSPFELWLQMTNTCKQPDFHPNAIKAMQRGTELEPVARALFEKSVGAAYPPITGEHDTYAFIRASLDGYNAELNRLLEIKCPGKEDHGKALKGKIPDKYYPQLQQQFLVSGASSGIYYSWDGKSAEGVAIEVLPDIEYMAKLQDALIQFWGSVQMHMPPTPTPKDLSRLIARLTTDLAKVHSSLTALEILGGAM